MASDNSTFDFGELFRSFADKNGSTADKVVPKPAINWPELIRRGTSHVRVAGEVYKVVVTKYEQKNAT